MRGAISRRGPDDHGLFVEDNVALGFNRLSIIDLSGGHQPMSTEDGAVTVVFNGEIYNYLELRRELEGKGYHFRTRSDTETILYTWELYGERCVEHLRGMFGFVIWDSRQKILFGARDRLGIKPFYYFHDSSQFAFASEIKALLQIPGLPREVDEEALAEFLLHRYVIAPKTMLRHVRKLPPGHTVTVRGKEVKTRCYWQVPTDVREEVREPDALEELGSLLDEVLRIHLLADVPLGAFLSGGIDSSAVVALMAKAGVRDIKTFSIGYDAPESELAYARIVANHCHTQHHELILTPEAFRDVLPEIVWSMDEPVGDEASIPLHYLARFARQTVTVALSGEGSDEIFAGYPIYQRMLGFEAWNRVPGMSLLGKLGSLLPEGKLRHYATMLGRPLEERHRGVSRVFSVSERERLLDKANGIRRIPNRVDAAYRRTASLPALTRLLHVDLETWMADDLLVKADRMSMANSLELRVPFLDHRLVEFAMRLPPSLKIQGGEGKYLLKKYMEPLLPREIIYRTKKGFPVPTKSWFRGELSGYARETLLDHQGATSDLFSRREIENLLQSHQQSDRGGPIYALLVFDQWYRLFVKKTVEPVAELHPAVAVSR